MQEHRASTRRGLASAFTLLAHVGCGMPSLPPATGAASDVLLLVDTPERPDLSTLQRALAAADSSLTPPEPAFLATTAVSGGRNERPREKNVVVVGRTDRPGPMLETLAPWLGPPRRQQLERDGGWVVLADVWARDQEVTLLLGRDAAGLDSLLQGAGVALREQLSRSILARSARVLSAHRTTPVARDLERLGFSMAAPPAYRRLPAVPGTAAIELAREAPARVVTVFWRDDVGPQDAARDDILLALQRTVMQRLHGDTLFVTSFLPAAAGAPRRVARGTWQNAVDVAGGPFVVHFVYDPARRRLYGVQAQLFAPGRRKRPFLVELESLLLTFQLEDWT